MNRTERFYRIDQLLALGQAVSKQTLLDELEMPWTMLKHDIAYIRERLNAPIIFAAAHGGYRFDALAIGPKYELPGLWFSPAEPAPAPFRTGTGHCRSIQHSQHSYNDILF
jgi:predicted DNA-binding transcriptional regulator YafY